MLKRLLIYIFFLLPLLGISCSEMPNNEEVKESPKKYRLEVDGKPFLMLGAQLRTDFFRQLDGRSLDQLDDYFSLAAGLNITVVQVPVSWSDVEIDYDVYTNETIRHFIDYCQKYELKLEILWFGSYMCGYSVEGHLPQYVVQDNKTYPELKPDAAYKGWQGKQFWLVPANKDLLERETKAIAKMMDFVYEYDKSLGSPHTVIGVQIENEPDLLPTWRCSELKLSSADVWPALLNHINAIGMAVKGSKYKCYTRVNQVISYEDYPYWTKKIFEREGIDYVGLDPYINNVEAVADMLKGLQELEGNFAHIAENGGEFFNNDILTLKALTMGCGYEVFEVITTPNPQLVDWTLRGVYNPDFTAKGQTRRLIDAYSIYKAAWYDFATCKVEDMIGFNMQNSEGLSSTSEEHSTSSYTINWSTQSRGIAFALENGSYLTVGSTKADLMSFSKQPSMVEAGHYKANGVWVTDDSVKPKLNGNELTINPCKVYRLYF